MKARAKKSNLNQHLEKRYRASWKKRLELQKKRREERNVERCKIFGGKPYRERTTHKFDSRTGLMIE